LPSPSHVLFLSLPVELSLLVLISPYKSIAFSWLEIHALTAVCKSAFVDGLKDDSSAISFDPTVPETSARKL
jgi:hypothetical protein